MAEKKNVMTPEFRVSFPYLFRTQPPMPGSTSGPKYGVVMLFKKGENLDALKKDAARAVRDKWGDNPPKNLRSPFRDQGDREGEGYVPGAIFITATSKTKPGVVDRNVQDIIDESEVYAGCYGMATVRAFAYESPLNKGVAFGLVNFQKTRDGEPLSGRTKPQDDFKPVEDAGDTTDDVFG